jgi:hypothetical protein
MDEGGGRPYFCFCDAPFISWNAATRTKRKFTLEEYHQIETVWDIYPHLTFRELIIKLFGEL